MEQKNCYVVLAVGAAIFLGCVMMMSFNKTNNGAEENMQKITVQSDNFSEGQRLSVDQTCEGKDLSPHLSWGNVITGAKSFSIVCDDPDAPSKTWVHWVIFNIPASVKSLAAGVSDDKILPNGARQGVNDFGKIGFGGACPPKGHGTHHYCFKVYALDVVLDLQPGCTKSDLVAAMDGHVLASGQLVGTYSRE